jgi:hypothetical protein
MALGGKRPGAGRKKGGKNASTLEKERVLAAFRERVMRSADLLFDAQMTLARGQTYLYKITKKWVGTGTHKYLRKERPEIVTSQVEIEAYLAGQLESVDDEGEGTTYYYITTKEPSNQAIEAMLDRALGKSTQAFEHSGPEGGAIIFMPAELIQKHQLSAKK